jgi:hypothetical protein
MDQMETKDPADPQGPRGATRAVVREPVTVSHAVKKELKILMIRMDLKNVGDVVEVLLKYYQDNHDMWPGGPRPTTTGEGTTHG